MIDGLHHLMTLRKAGLRPRSLIVSIECPYKRPKYINDFEDMELTVHESVAHDDFRAFKDMQLTLYAGAWNQLAADVLEKLKGYAEEITVLCADYGNDIGYFWHREYGVKDYGDKEYKK